MSNIKSRSELKSHFENGDIPNESDFSDLIDSCIHQTEDGLTAKNVGGSPRLGVGPGIVDPLQTLELREMGNPGGGPTGMAIINMKVSGPNQGWEIGHCFDSDVMSGKDGKLVINELSQTDGSIERLTVAAGGNVGIGIEVPAEKLDVDGMIKSNLGVLLTGAPTSSPDLGTIGYRNGDIQAYLNLDGTGADWVSLSAQGSGGGGSGTVSSVNGISPVNGNVTLTKSSLSLGNVDNTSDANKQISTATQNALDLKADALDVNRVGVTQLVFDRNSEYGNEDAPATGNISLQAGGSHKQGVTALIIHNNSGSGIAPSFGSEFVELTGSSGYDASKTNYIFCNYRKSDLVLYSISQLADLL